MARMAASSSPRLGIMTEWEGWMETWRRDVGVQPLTPAMNSGREERRRVV